MSFNPTDSQHKQEFVREVFATIAHRYDLLNTILSFNRDKAWRRFAVGRCGLRPGMQALDVACGTGMLSFELARAVGPGGRVVGIDFCPEMLERANANRGRHPFGGLVTFQQGNAIDLPFPDAAFDCATIGFALRNVPDVKKTIAEMARVVRPGGRVVSLEFGKPSLPVFKQAYYLYLNGLIPVLGRLGVGRKGPYNWLAQSQNSFMHQSAVRDLFADVGLADACYYELTGGIVAVHVGTRV
ncbi:MAG: class I SAM-dependent methyltransferase [Bacillota bacterium]|nr:class I SAM-dependent methyltransferase [Bacillota bacterium]